MELNVAVTVCCDAVTATVHVGSLPEQLPDHPANAFPAGAVAVSVTLVPSANPAPQLDPHEMPVGLEVTVPIPVPTLLTVTRGNETRTSSGRLSLRVDPAPA